MVQKAIDYAPGLYKIFDEILVNAADNKARDASMDTLRVDINVVRMSFSFRCILHASINNITYTHTQCAGKG